MEDRVYKDVAEDLTLPDEGSMVFRVYKVTEGNHIHTEVSPPVREGTYEHTDYKWRDLTNYRAEYEVIHGRGALGLRASGRR